MALKCPMFGYFTNERADTRGMNLEGESVVQVRPETISLHSWIRRAASKLTIDFDGSNLRENVTVYIKDARVYDVADGCYLGLYSAAGTPEAGSTINGGFGMVCDGSERVDEILRSAMLWDVMGGVARRSWARNEHAMETSEEFNQAYADTYHITMPYVADNELIRKVIENN